MLPANLLDIGLTFGCFSSRFGVSPTPPVPPPPKVTEPSLSILGPIAFCLGCMDPTYYSLDAHAFKGTTYMYT